MGSAAVPLAPDAFTYTSLITACAKAQPAARVDEAMEVLDRMLEIELAHSERHHVQQPDYGVRQGQAGSPGGRGDAAAGPDGG
jgi:pentatricopeptide repeat protein